jgi:hypothetical protein
LVNIYKYNRCSTSRRLCRQNTCADDPITCRNSTYLGDGFILRQSTSTCVRSLPPGRPYAELILHNKTTQQISHACRLGSEASVVHHLYGVPSLLSLGYCIQFSLPNFQRDFKISILDFVVLSGELLPTVALVCRSLYRHAYALRMYTVCPYVPTPSWSHWGVRDETKLW